MAVSGTASARGEKFYEVVAYEAWDNGTREQMLICGTSQWSGSVEHCLGLKNVNWAWKRPGWLWKGTVKLIAFDPHGETPPAAKVFTIDPTREGKEYTVSWDELHDPLAHVTIPRIAPSEGCREVDARTSLPENSEETGYELAEDSMRPADVLARRLEAALPLCGLLRAQR